MYAIRYALGKIFGVLSAGGDALTSSSLLVGAVLPLEISDRLLCVCQLGRCEPHVPMRSITQPPNQVSRSRPAAGSLLDFLVDDSLNLPFLMILDHDHVFWVVIISTVLVKSELGWFQIGNRDYSMHSPVF